MPQDPFREVKNLRLAERLRYSARAMSASVQKRLFTVHDYDQMGVAGILPPDERVELVNGEILRMSPIGPAHNAAVNRATRALVRAVGDDAIVQVQGSVRLNLFNEPQPDIVLLRPAADFYAGNRPSVSDILLIVEMADSSLQYDRTAKARLYAEMGLTEYWVASLQEECVYAYSEAHQGSYRTIQRYHRGDSIRPFLLEQFSIPVDSLLP